jgi:hypothetical protein
MKNIFLKIIAAQVLLISVILTSCDSDKLTELNKDPNKVETVIPAYSFTSLVMNSNADYNYQSLGQGLQYLSTYREIGAPGDKLITFGGGGNNQYTGNLNRINHILDQIPGPENVNKRAACIMLRVFAIANYTDVVGDIPYSEAQKGLSGLQPKYDRQKDIYAGLLAELDAALTSMDATKPNVFGANDPYYGGDVLRWKKYGYTLMLRLGMRMSEVDPASAKSWVQKAIAGGVMSATTDIAYQKYANVSGQQNPRATNLLDADYSVLGGDNAQGGKYAAKFINYLKDTKDPRLAVISVVWKPKPGGGYNADTLMADQRGMINGSVNGNPVDFDTYSEPSLLYLNFASPIVNVSPAEAYLLLAEAAIRGWYTGATPKAMYDLAVTRGMQQWALWPSVAPHSGVISQAQIDSYLLHGNPFKTTGTFEEQLEQIITQKWVCLFGNDYEVWSEWRRTKYPVFNYKNWKNSSGQLVAYPGSVTGGHMWRHFTLPASELTTNKDNYFAGLAAEGFQEGTLGLLQERVWWDTPARGNGEAP